jgi:hypothetical protein
LLQTALVLAVAIAQSVGRGRWSLLEDIFHLILPKERSACGQSGQQSGQKRNISSESHEIAAYGTVSEFAKLLGQNEHVSLLEETLQEEKDTDEKLTSLAKEINPQANEGMKEEPRVSRKSPRL